MEGSSRSTLAAFARRDDAHVTTTGRGMYVALTRGRRSDHVLVVTATHDVAEAREILDHVITNARADVSALTRRQQLRDDRLDAVFQRWIDEPVARPRPSRAGGEIA